MDVSRHAQERSEHHLLQVDEKSEPCAAAVTDC